MRQHRGFEPRLPLKGQEHQYESGIQPLGKHLFLMTVKKLQNRRGKITFIY